MDFDPRDYDSRDDERYGSNQSLGSRGASDDRDRDDDWSQPHIRSGDRDDDARHSVVVRGLLKRAKQSGAI